MNNGIIMPNYEHSILNTITSILKYYKVETKHKSLDCLDKILEKRYKNIVFIVLDGLGEKILKNIRKNLDFSKKIHTFVLYF